MNDLHEVHDRKLKELQQAVTLQQHAKPIGR